MGEFTSSHPSSWIRTNQPCLHLEWCFTQFRGLLARGQGPLSFEGVDVVPRTD